MLSTLCLTALLGIATAADDPHRQFDFWVGEWSVHNRHIQVDGTWRSGEDTRARITPVCGDRAVLEEWAGPFNGAFMNGFSLRAYDPARDRWSLLLFWTTDGNAGFGRLEGSFRHGRGEFFSGSAPRLTRYTFSDGLPQSVRWDSARTTDNGQNWRTDWIMEFSRTRPAAEVTQDNLFATDWTEGKVSPHEEARQLDWLLGEWRGLQTDADGEEREARLRCKLLNKDCLVLDLLQTRRPGTEVWDERLSIRGFESRAKAWASWQVTNRDTLIRRSRTSFEEDEAISERGEPGSDDYVEERILRVDAVHVTIEEFRRGPDGESITVTTELERVGI